MKIKIIKYVSFYLLFVVCLGFLQASPYSFLDKGSMNHLSANISESMEKGCFVDKALVSPSTIEIDNIIVTINEVWIERKHDFFFIIELIPFVYEKPLYKTREGYNICLNFKNDSNAVILSKKAFFVIETEGGAFGISSSNDGYLHTAVSVNNLNWETLNLAIVKKGDWREILMKNIVIEKR